MSLTPHMPLLRPPCAEPLSAESELPHDLPALIAACEALHQQGQLAAALRLLETASAALPGSPELMVERACLLADLGRGEEARADCRQALALVPTYLYARFTLAFLLYQAEKLPESLAELETLTASEPAYPNALWLRAAILRQLHGDHDARVLLAFDAILAADPQNVYAQVERADVLRAQGRYEEARDVYARLRHLAGDENHALRIEAAFKLGCVALVLQDNALARSAFLAVLSVAPTYPDAREMLEMVEEVGG